MSPDLSQIHAPHQVPDRASTVVLVDQSLDVNGMQKQLRTVNRSQARWRWIRQGAHDSTV